MEPTSDSLHAFYTDFFSAWNKQETLADAARRTARHESVLAAAEARSAERLHARQAARNAQFAAHKAIRRMSLLVEQRKTTREDDEQRGTAY